MNTVLLHCLAYGSNLHPYRLIQRVPSATAIGVVPMPGKRLAFHKRSTDGSGKCLLLDSGIADDIVYGVIYEFRPADKNRLDALEGLGAGYTEQLVSAPVNGKAYQAYAYVAASTHIDSSLAPYEWYKEMVLLGARYHALPADYIAKIEAVAAIRDPDPARRAKNEAILVTMRHINSARGR